MIREAAAAAFAQAVTKYGAIVGGLAIGTAAKYGLALTDGKRLTLKGAVADLLLLGMLGLMAVLFSEALHLTGNAKVLVGALAAVSSDRLIRLARDRFLKAADGQMSKLLPPVEQEAVVEVPAGTGQPDTVRVQVPPVTRPERMASNLRRAFKRPRGAPEDHIALLREIDQQD